MDKLSEFVAGMLPDFVALLCPNLEENTHSLQRKIGLLGSRKHDVHEKLQNEECHSGKKRKREVEDWRNNVENIIKDFETLEQRVQQSSRFYHVFKRQKLAEELERMTEEVTELVAQSEFPSGLFLEVDESIDRMLLIPQPDGQAFRQNVDAIWTSLMDANVVSIGIYGMGGVGKTTLARRVHDKLLKESTFSRRVYWVTVSQEFSIYKLQSDIAQLLKLDNITDENDEGRRAAKLFRKFQKMERFVLILDDVWKRIDAEKIGIPSEKDGCKLVITSRSEEVCRSMCCKKIIKVKTLSEKEALNLFMKTLHRDGLSVEEQEICKKMVSRCDGLPLALITLAGSMRSVNDIHEWRDALEGLKESCLARADMEDEVLPILLNSYHPLRDTRLQNCFLYCSLYPDDFRIWRDKLIENFISEELMERRSSWKAEVDQGHAILNQLERACLLESDSYRRLKMHDLIREMAKRITKEKPRYMVKAGLHLKELPEEQEWTEDLDKVSLMDNSIMEISDGTSPKCPSLSTLILSGNPLRSIPDCFFTHMRGLRTLNLSRTDIESLPNSISDLEKLNELSLARCYKLVSVPSLEKLKVLKQLDLTETKIEEIPRGMESLTNLKSLSLLCRRLKMIPTGTLYRLTHLQRLELPLYFVVPIEEFEALKQLELLQCRLNSVRDLNRLINSRQSDKQFLSYNITLSTLEFYERCSFYLSIGKYLSFEEKSLVEFSSDTDGNLLSQDVETLYFFRSGLRGCLLDEFPIPNSARTCEIKEEDKIECIMRLEEEFSWVPFQNLEGLYLMDLPNLIGLFKWEAVVRLPPGTFSCLLALLIDGCGKIKKLFPQSLVHNFHSLQSLSVVACVQMEEIIEDEIECIMRLEEAFSWVPFQSLKRLKLRDLPNLIGIFKWEAVVPLPPGTFSCLEELRIYGCGKIKKLFPQSLVRNFHNLKELSVGNCVQMEEIIEDDDNNEGADITLPMLKELNLWSLPQLKSICKGKMICDDIEVICLRGIKNIKKLPLYLPFLHGQLSPPTRLRTISIEEGEREWWESLEWPHHNANNVLQPLVYFNR